MASASGVNSEMRLVFSWEASNSNFYANLLKNKAKKVSPLSANTRITFLAITIIAVVAGLIAMIAINPIVGSFFAFPILVFGLSTFIGILAMECQKRKEFLSGNVDSKKDYNQHVEFAKQALIDSAKNPIEQIKNKYESLGDKENDEGRSLLISALAIRILENKNGYNAVRGKSNFSCIQFKTENKGKYLEVTPLKNDKEKPFRILLDERGLENLFGNEVLNLRKEVGV